jgi:hypothetical protein
MFTNDEILSEYAKVRTYAPPPFVVKIDGRSFILAEVTHRGRTFNLKLGEAFPSAGGPPIIALKTKAQIEAQVREFIIENWVA